MKKTRIKQIAGNFWRSLLVLSLSAVCAGLIACSGGGNKSKPEKDADGYLYVNKSNWYPNRLGDMSADQGKFAVLSNDSGNLTVTGEGTVTNRDILEADSFRFESSVKYLEGIEDGFAEILIRKGTRDSFYGKDSYALRIWPSGKIEAVRYKNDVPESFASAETGLDLTQRQLFDVNIEKSDTQNCVISVSINGAEAMRFTDEKSSYALGKYGFFGLRNSSNGVSSELFGLRILGTEERYDAGKKTAFLLYPDYLEEDGKRLLHWEYKSDFTEYKGVRITSGKKTVAEVTFPCNSYELGDGEKYSQYYLIPVGIDGDGDRQLVRAKDDRSEQYAENVKRIEIRESEDGAYFVYAGTDEKWIMNGTNYVGIRYGDHSTFEPASKYFPGYYDPLTIDSMMCQMKEHGYNCLRVFVLGGRREGNPGLAGDRSTNTPDLCGPYMDNVVDMLRRAHKYGIYILVNFTENEMINNKYWSKLARNASGQSILFSESGLEAKAEYLKLFLEYIKERDPKAMDSLMALSMQNEFVFWPGQQPFSKKSGDYKFLDGKTYDMADYTDRRALANAAINNYYATMKKAIREVVPEMLVCEGTFTNRGVHLDVNDPDVWGLSRDIGAERYPMTIPEMLSTDLDFLDVHVYRYGSAGDAQKIFEDNMSSMKFYDDETKELLKKKPLVMGEYGANKFDSDEASVEAGMAFLKGLQNAAMDAGFSGSLLWTHDSFMQTGIWVLMEENGEWLDYLTLIK